MDTLKVTVIDAGLPTASASANIFIEVERTVQIEVSSVITTNGDFINDTCHNYGKRDEYIEVWNVKWW